MLLSTMATSTPPPELGTGHITHHPISAFFALPAILPTLVGPAVTRQWRPGAPLSSCKSARSCSTWPEFGVELAFEIVVDCDKLETGAVNNGGEATPSLQEQSERVGWLRASVF
jgi:hypothetical protein